MIHNEIIQADIVRWLKAEATITAALIRAVIELQALERYVVVIGQVDGVAVEVDARALAGGTRSTGIADAKTRRSRLFRPLHGWFQPLNAGLSITGVSGRYGRHRGIHKTFHRWTQPDPRQCRTARKACLLPETHCHPADRRRSSYHCAAARRCHIQH